MVRVYYTPGGLFGATSREGILVSVIVLVAGSTRPYDANVPADLTATMKGKEM